MEFSAVPLAETRVYEAPHASEAANIVPASAVLELIECIETGSDFYYLVRTRNGSEGYVFDLRMRYEAEWKFPDFDRLRRGPLRSLSCVTMTQRWGISSAHESIRESAV